MTKTETASRLRVRIEAVLDYARVHGWREGDNPARWKGNQQSAGFQLRNKVAPVGHHPALPWQDLHDFWAVLKGQDATAAWSSEFLTLTTARTTEVIKAGRSEINREAAIWTIPKEHMKERKEHRVPLSAAAKPCWRGWRRSARPAMAAASSPA